MKIYKLDIDTSKPITQTLAVPQDAEQYGIAVKVLKDGSQISASVTIDDGQTTLTPAKTLEDGSQLFVLSSVDSGSRDVKVNVQVNPLVIPDTTIGRQLNCSVKVQLDERIDAEPDAEIEYTDALVDSDFEKNETEWKTITIDGVEYKLLCAKEVN